MFRHHTKSPFLLLAATAALLPFGAGCAGKGAGIPSAEPPLDVEVSASMLEKLEQLKEAFKYDPPPGSWHAPHDYRDNLNAAVIYPANVKGKELIVLSYLSNTGEKGFVPSAHVALPSSTFAYNFPGGVSYDFNVRDTPIVLMSVNVPNKPITKTEFDAISGPSEILNPAIHKDPVSNAGYWFAFNTADGKSLGSYGNLALDNTGKLSLNVGGGLYNKASLNSSFFDTSDRNNLAFAIWRKIYMPGFRPTPAIRLSP